MNERFAEFFDRLPDLFGGHLLLSVPAILVGVLISVPLGVLCAKVSLVRGPTLTVASLFQTVPSIALLAIMVAIMGGTIGYRPAFIALLIYSVLPILRNTFTGIDEVDPAMREAARGVGMTPLQSLWRVELPLALPVILAGIRTATVWVVGITTLSTPVGAPSLGNYIFSGLQLRDWNQVYFGCIFAMALTVVLDQIVRLFEVSARRQKAWISVAAGIVLAAILGAGLTPKAGDIHRFAMGVFKGEATDLPAQAGDHDARAAEETGPLLDGQSFKIGAKGFTEQAIMGRLLKQQLARHGASAEVLGNMGSTILFDALRNGTIDMYVDYTGTIWATVMNREEPLERTAMFIQVSHHLLEEDGILTFGRLGFENAYCLAVRRKMARSKGYRSIRALTEIAGQLKLGGSPEFFGRPEWTRVRNAYDLKAMKTQGMDATFMYQAVRDKQVDVIAGFSTDGRIDAFNLTVLSDPAQAFPPYDAIILLSSQAAKNNALHRALSPLLNSIDAAKMRGANRMVDLDRKTPARAAATLLPPGP